MWNLQVMGSGLRIWRPLMGPYLDLFNIVAKHSLQNGSGWYVTGYDSVIANRNQQRQLPSTELAAGELTEKPLASSLLSRLP